MLQQNCVSMYMASSEGRLGLAAGRVLWHTYQVEELERMLRVRYVRASRLCYGKPQGKPVIVFDCPFDSTQLGRRSTSSPYLCVKYRP